jgi:hypothetical protein
MCGKEYLRMHRENVQGLDREGVARIEGEMPRPKARYSLLIKNHLSGESMKVELIDLPFTEGRRFRLRVNGRWAVKVPVASKTAVLRELRGWLVRH